MQRLPFENNPNPKAVNGWRRAFTKNIIAFGVFCALFGLPVVGTLSMRVVYGLVGCSFGFDYQPACMVLGFDISHRMGAYGAPILGMLLTPIIFLAAFWELLLAWLVVIFFLLFKAEAWRAKP
jgi:hypothetical protein